MVRRNDAAIRTLRIKKGDDLKTIYAKVRKSFTAADLARYADLDEEMYPIEGLLKELDAINREETKKRKLRKSKKA
ncbi:MAG TPA: hypothetical protein VG099_12325 [Gemmataceae bacterium]|jgi:hypothetical protein|nr:hypothetical protein [Gemmataceae bacterium]